MTIVVTDTKITAVKKGYIQALSNDDITIDFEEKKVSSELGSKNITRQD
jgi:hypothetical protein